MANVVQTTSPAEIFRAIATERLHAVADMTLHDLLDEFMRLSKVIEDGVIPQEDEYAPSKYTDEAKVAAEERKLVLGASRARFGVGFSLYESDF